VPYYDPMYVYGSWWYPDYPPYYWGPGPRLSIGLGIGFWPGFYFSTSFTSWCWPDWHARYVYVDVHKRPRYVAHERWVPVSGRWHHRPSHRRGLIYRDITTARKYSSHPIRPERFNRDPRVFSAPRVQDRLQDRRLNAPEIRGRRDRASVRPPLERNKPQRPVVERPDKRPSIDRGDKAHRPGMQMPQQGSQGSTRIQPETRQRSVEQPRSQAPSSRYNDRRQRPGLQPPNHVSPRTQAKIQQRLGTPPRVQGTPRTRPDRQVKQGISPVTPRLSPGAQGTKRVQHPTPRREHTVRNRSGILNPQTNRGTISRRFEETARHSFSGPRSGFSPRGSSRHPFDGHGR
jgi:hypothetical protein